MLAECYKRQPSGQDKRLAALRRAATEGTTTAIAGPMIAAELENQGRLDEAIKIHTGLLSTRPESRLDQVRLLIRKTARLPREQRVWSVVEDRLRAAEAALPRAVEELTLLRADLLATEGRPDEARSVLDSASRKDSSNLKYRLTLARIATRQGKSDDARRILERAEKDLGPSLEIDLEWLSFWSRRGGDEARSAVTRLAQGRYQVPQADRAAFLEALARAVFLLGQPTLARQYWGELAASSPTTSRSCCRSSTWQSSSATVRVHESSWIGFARWRGMPRAPAGGSPRRLSSSSTTAAIPGVTEQSKLCRMHGHWPRRILDLRSNWWGGHTLLGQIAELDGSTADAVEHYVQAARQGYVQPALAGRLLAMLYRQVDDPKRYIDQVTELLRENGFPVDELTIVNALDAIRKGDAARGISLARQVLPDDSRDFADHLAMGRVYAAAQQSAKAGEEYRRAVELAPGVPETWIQLVRYLASQPDQASQAKAVIEAAARALPADRADLTLALCWTSVGDTRRAEALYRKIDLRETKDPAVLKSLELYYFDQGRLKEAEEVLDRLEAIPALSEEDRMWASRSRPILLLKTGRLRDLDEALRQVEENLKKNPTRGEGLRFKAGILAMRPSRQGEAIKVLEEMGTTNSLRPDDRLLLADLYLNQKQQSQYEAEIREIVGPGKANPPRALTYHANYLLERNRLDEAEQQVALLKKSDPLGVTALELKLASSTSATTSPRYLPSWKTGRVKSLTRLAWWPIFWPGTDSRPRPNRPSRRSSPVGPTSRNGSLPWRISTPRQVGSRKRWPSSARRGRPCPESSWPGQAAGRV